MRQEEVLERDVSGAAAEGAGDGTESVRAISPILPTSIQQEVETSKSYDFKITLSGTYTWTISTKEKWIWLSTTEGQGTATVRCTVTAAAAGSVGRNGEIIFIYMSPSVTKKITIPVEQFPLVWPVGGSQYKEGEIQTATDYGMEGYPAKGKVVSGAWAISSFYGARFTVPKSNYLRHWAIDIDIVEGNDTTKVLAAMRGKIVKIGKNHSTNGNYVYMEHTAVGDDNTRVTLYTRYLHLASDDFCKNVKEEDFIEAKTELGFVGDTGSAKGDNHLHFAVLKKIGTVNYLLNPVPYYHGSDDRGVKSASSASELKAYENNPMFILQGTTWVRNFYFDPLYSDFKKTSDSFYSKFLHAKRDGGIVEYAKQ